MSLQERRRKYEEINIWCSQPFSEIERFLSNMGFRLSTETVDGNKKTYMPINERKGHLDVLHTKKGYNISGEVIEAAAQQFNKYKSSVN